MRTKSTTSPSTLQLPNKPEREKELLAALIMSASARAFVFAPTVDFSSEYLYSRARRLIYERILTMHINHDDVALDLLVSALEESGELERVGGGARGE